MASLQQFFVQIGGTRRRPREGKLVGPLGWSQEGYNVKKTDFDLVEEYQLLNNEQCYLYAV